MITAAILTFKNSFGFIFRDWRITLLIVILVCFGFFAYKYKQTQKNLETVQLSLKAEQDNNAVLRNNLAIASKVNSENIAVFQAVKVDNTLTTAAVSKLNIKLRANDKTAVEIKETLSSVKEPKEKVSPRIAIAVSGIQKLRDEAGAQK